jgi:hypothetical protein
MSSRSAAARVIRVTQAAYNLRRFETLARGAKPRGRLCVVYGNCQAEPLRVLLNRSSEFADRYEAVRIPAVHEISASQLAKLERVLRAASLIIAQPVKDDYRGLPLGTNQVVALAPRDCSVIRFPALYYDALYPLQVNVIVDDWLAAAAPMTVHHDLRTLCAAANGLSPGEGVRWVSHYRPPEAALRSAAEQAAATVRRRESMTDIRVLDRITATPQAHARSFFTVDHPTRLVLQYLATSVCDLLGLPAGSDAHDGREPLGAFRAPLEQTVIDVLGLAGDPTSDWVIKGRQVSMEEVIRLHLAWYQERADVVDAGRREHADRIAAFGLLG